MASTTAARDALIGAQRDGVKDLVDAERIAVVPDGVAPPSRRDGERGLDRVVPRARGEPCRVREVLPGVLRGHGVDVRRPVRRLRPEHDVHLGAAHGQRRAQELQGSARRPRDRALALPGPRRSAAAGARVEDVHAPRASIEERDVDVVAPGGDRGRPRGLGCVPVVAEPDLRVPRLSEVGRPAVVLLFPTGVARTHARAVVGPSVRRTVVTLVGPHHVDHRAPGGDRRCPGRHAVIGGDGPRLCPAPPRIGRAAEVDLGAARARVPPDDVSGVGPGRDRGPGRTGIVRDLHRRVPGAAVVARVADEDPEVPVRRRMPGDVHVRSGGGDLRRAAQRGERCLDPASTVVARTGIHDRPQRRQRFAGLEEALHLDPGDVDHSRRIDADHPPEVEEDPRRTGGVGELPRRRPRGVLRGRPRQRQRRGHRDGEHGHEPRRVSLFRHSSRHARVCGLRRGGV